MTTNKKTIMITGGNSGLGFAAAKIIASRYKDYQLILACRNLEKANMAVNELQKSTDNQNIIAMELDVSSLHSVRKFVANFQTADLGLLDGILCNAGINGNNTGLTKDGFDVVFETNHLGHFLLTNLLVPFMREDGRIVLVSSDMHNPPGDNLTWPGVPALAYPSESLNTHFIRYSYSKLCNLYFTYSLVEKLAYMKSKITVNAFNPGLLTTTNFAPDKSRFTEEFMKQIEDRIGTLEVSSEALANLMTDSKYDYVTGKYFDRGVEILSSPLSYDENNRTELWKKSIAYTDLKVTETLPELVK
ncbi:SDR family NAD(P)-dependent oxidoreductase [Listeria seeligeri]|uniref:SDR family NAD(P)-dependent oxidoreductase n=1 Tax=Listeria seeligeri TaxID=1640 RepID=UPI00162A7711|nr:SDR family NAD(P)-dependent oxidoreductase [Listeria seeligeri]MBC1576669.1 SDR family NAD(P)-dependent oxidoreductase [Listeria seeligeri]MBC1592558.1 SDR family NAD(P)-dependent oxidoreductase [Listeria seeligeri]MBC1914905.1 SDR family NAD(P)-dependent oxidoreductase [Listeria seeligeri]MBC2197373.1 SDR family NAD(P)-dependent oxidoreductase [Listeria seeligeri]MBC2211626.1 SDR family NAD(P)-dependent oxidoreductase [Listeria seeligeri]